MASLHLLTFCAILLCLPTNALTSPGLATVFSNGCAYTCAYGLYSTGDTGTLACPSGLISNVSFFSYGTPRGNCGTYTVAGSCNQSFTVLAQQIAVVQKFCVGKSSCQITSYRLFPSGTSADPCVNVDKWWAAEASCC